MGFFKTPAEREAAAAKETADPQFDELRAVPRMAALQLEHDVRAIDAEQNAARARVRELVMLELMRMDRLRGQISSDPRSIVELAEKYATYISSGVKPETAPNAPVAVAA